VTAKAELGAVGISALALGDVKHRAARANHEIVKRFVGETETRSPRVFAKIQKAGLSRTARPVPGELQRARNAARCRVRTTHADVRNPALLLRLGKRKVVAQAK